MPWDDSSEILVGQSGELYTAAVGSTAPVNATSTPAPGTFTGMGYNNTDGLRIESGRELFRLNSWQQLTPTRIARQSETFRLGAVLQQWNDATTPLAFGGGSITNPSGSVYKYTPPALTEALDERMVLADVVDGSRHLRIIIPRAIVVETVEATFNRTSAAELPVTLEALTPSDGAASWYFLSDDAAAYATGS